MAAALGHCCYLLVHKHALLVVTVPEPLACVSACCMPALGLVITVIQMGVLGFRV